MDVGGVPEGDPAMQGFLGPFARGAIVLYFVFGDYANVKSMPFHRADETFSLLGLFATRRHHRQGET